MKTKLTLFSLLFIIPAFFYGQEAQQYEYLSMTKEGNYIFLSKPLTEMEKIEIKDEFSSEKHSEVYDYGPVLMRIQKFEEDGWEMVENQVYALGTVAVRNYVLMRRKL